MNITPDPTSSIDNRLHDVPEAALEPVLQQIDALLSALERQCDDSGISDSAFLPILAEEFTTALTRMAERLKVETAKRTSP